MTRPREMGYDGREEVPVSRFRCRMCGYIYDEATEGGLFADLPDWWSCPICGAAKSEFEKV